MIMATMNNNHIALTMDSCFVSTLESAQTSSYDTYSGSGSSHSDAEYDVEDSTFVNHSVPFPWKLHEMLEIAEQENFTNIVSWLPDRQSFKVYQTDIFVQDIMPKYFRQTKYKSFQRQLNMWGFERLLAGPSKGGYLHQHFKRGQPALCRYMKRLKIKGTGNKKPVQSPFETSSVPKVKSSTTRKSPGRVVSRGAAKSMYQCIPPESSCFAQVESDARSVSFPPFETIHVPVVRQEMLNACSGTIGHSPCNVDLFDEDTLASVLSTVLENPAGIENVPNEGDCVIFEGMQFFFVEEHRAPHASRRLSIGLGRGVVGAPNRRFSLVGAQTASSTPIGSVEPPQGYAASNHSSSMGRQRANRRFSLQRTSSSGSNAYILKQIVEI